MIHPGNIVKRTFGEKLEHIAHSLMSEVMEPSVPILTKGIQQKYLKHAFKDPATRRPDVRVRAMDLPVCPKCERLTFRDRRLGDPPPVWGKDEYGGLVKTNTFVTCPVCHYHGPPGPPARIHVKEV